MLVIYIYTYTNAPGITHVSPIELLPILTLVEKKLQLDNSKIEYVVETMNI